MKDRAEQDLLSSGFATFDRKILRWFPLVAAMAISVGYLVRFSVAPAPGLSPSDLGRLALGPAALFPAMQLIVVLFGRISHRRTATDWAHTRARLFIGIVVLAIQAVWLRSQAADSVTEAFLVTVFIGSLLTVAGFFMSTSKQNVFFGVRTPWTLGDPRVWEHTHRFAGPVTMVTGGLCFVLGALLSPPTALAFALAITLASAGLQIFYSRLVARDL